VIPSSGFGENKIAEEKGIKIEEADVREKARQVILEQFGGLPLPISWVINLTAL